MAAPVILRIQSVLEYLQWQEFEFLPYAMNTPTFWNVSGLPPGLVFNPANGRISGAATKPGVWVCGIIAGNADGLSAVEVFTIGVEASTYSQPVDAIDATIELGSGAVTITPAASIDASINVDASTAKPTDLKPLLWLKRGDTKIFHLRFVKGGVIADIDLTSLKLGFKAFEPEQVIVQSLGFARVATGAETMYRLAIAVTSSALDSELSNTESDVATHVIGLAEFEWKWTNELVPPVAPNLVRSSSLNFAAAIARDLLPDA